MLKNLLAMNRKALIGLHNIGWLDFQKPYLISEYHGNFTANSILKAMNIGKYDIDAYNIYVLYTDPRRWSNHEELYLARMYGTGKFESQRNDIEGYEAAHGWRWLNTVVGKSTFEEIRKHPEGHYFVVVQEKAYENHRSKVVDRSARFKPIYSEYNPARVDYIVPTGRRVDNYYDNIMVTWSYGTPRYSYELDKSGYLVSENRANYEQRAKKLRTERAEKAAAAWDNTATIKNIDERVARINQAMAKLLTGKAEEVDYSVIYGITQKLQWVKSDIANLRKNTYGSMNGINSAIKYVDEKLTDAESALNIEMR